MAIFILLISRILLPIIWIVLAGVLTYRLRHETFFLIFFKLKASEEQIRSGQFIH